MRGPRSSPAARAPLAGLEVAILGAGAVAGAFADELARAGASVRLWARRPSQAQALRRRQKGVRLAAERDLAEALTGARAILIAVGDGALEEVAARAAQALPRLLPRSRAPVALHTHGALGPEALAPLAARGSAVGVLHPLVPLVRRGSAGLKGAHFALAGERGAVALARRLVRGLGGQSLVLRGGAEAQLAYHAAASLAAGGLVVIFDAALRPFSEASRAPHAARAALAALLSATLDNLGRGAPAEVLTGAAVRGSAELVAAHLGALPEGARRLYGLAVRRMVELGLARGTLAAADAARVLAVVDARG